MNKKLHRFLKNSTDNGILKLPAFRILNNNNNRVKRKSEIRKQEERRKLSGKLQEELPWKRWDIYVSKVLPRGLRG